VKGLRLLNYPWYSDETPSVIIRNNMVQQSVAKVKPLTKDDAANAGKRRVGLVVKYHIEKRTMYLQAAVIVNETKLPEFIHENIDATARRPYQFGQRFL
jgi:hypothetical protein